MWSLQRPNDSNLGTRLVMKGWSEDQATQTSQEDSC